jgi:hypothetical protein
MLPVCCVWLLLGESSVHVKSGPDQRFGCEVLSSVSDELFDLGLQLNLYCTRQGGECQPVGSVHKGIRYVEHDSFKIKPYGLWFF